MKTKYDNPMPTSLLDKLKSDLSAAKKDKTLKKEWTSKSWGYEEGYLISYQDLEDIVKALTEKL